MLMAGTLKEACRNVLSFCLGLKKKENVLVLFDRANEELALELAKEAKSIGASPYLLELPFGIKTDEFPHLTIAAAEGLKETDALIILSSGNMIRNLNLGSFCDPHHKPRNIKARSLYIPGFPIESLVRIMSIDFEEYESYQSRMLEALRGVRSIRIRAPAGTDVSFKAREFGHTPYKAYAPGGYALLHFGEVWTAPIEDFVKGTIVYDASLAMGRIRSRLKLYVSKGRIVEEEIIGGPDNIVEEFLSALKSSDENARVVGEVGIGLNPNAKLSGCIMEDESIRGTIHIDFWDNIAFRGVNKSNFHGGGVITKPTIEADGRQVIVEGLLHL